MSSLLANKIVAKLHCDSINPLSNKEINYVVNLVNNGIKKKLGLKEKIMTNIEIIEAAELRKILYNAEVQIRNKKIY